MKINENESFEFAGLYNIYNIVIEIAIPPHLVGT